MRPFFVLLAFLLLGACAAPTEPKIETQFVDRPIAASCVPDNLGPAPAYPDTDAALLAAPDGPTRYQLLADGHVLRQQRSNQVEPVIAKCRSAAPLPTPLAPPVALGIAPPAPTSKPWWQIF